MKHKSYLGPPKNVTKPTDLPIPPPCYAVNDPDSVFSHVAFVWEDGAWQFLCAGRTDSEFRSRVNYWVGKGYEPAQIKEYAVQACAICCDTIYDNAEDFRNHLKIAHSGG